MPEGAWEGAQRWGGGGGVGWWSAHGGRPRFPLVASSVRWGHRMDLAQACQAWPGETWARWCWPGHQAS